MDDDGKRLREALDVSVRNAGSFDEFVGFLDTLAPEMAERLQGKALISTRSPWGVLICYVVGAILAFQILHMSTLYASVLVGAFVLIGAFIMRFNTVAPVTGILRPGQV